MAKKELFHKGIIILCLLLLPLALADEIEFSFEQKEYYFKVNEQASIVLSTKNTYDIDITGSLTHSLTSNIQTGNSISTQSNTQSSPFQVTKGESQISMQFGSSSAPQTMDNTFTFTYKEDDKDMQVKIENILIYFVQEEEEKENQENQQQAQSEDPNKKSLSEQLKEKLEEMQKKPEQQPKSDTAQKAQNNALNQNTQALKNQIQKENQEKNKQREEFANNLANQESFQEQHQKLTEEGYQVTDNEINPTDSENGDFELTYQNQNGDSKTLSGEIQNNSLDSLAESSEKIDKETQKQLEETNFDELEEKLKEEGFKQKNTTTTYTQNDTKLEIEYKDENNNTAKITADIENGEIKNLKVEKEKNYVFYFIIILFLIGLYAYYYYQKMQKAKQTREPEKEQAPKSQINYIKKTQEYLKKAQEKFNNKEEKEAYHLTSYALRYFYSNKHNLNKEITNDELIRMLKEKENTKEIKTCLNMCSLVEFAKYTPNKKDFSQIIQTAKKLTK
ncbi:MAG: hypothetical protein ACI83O_000278 [Patescibacteria group bacterium]|jgi:hypothetical protein